MTVDKLHGQGAGTESRSCEGRRVTSHKQGARAYTVLPRERQPCSGDMLIAAHFYVNILTSTSTPQSSFDKSDYKSGIHYQQVKHSNSRCATSNTSGNVSNIQSTSLGLLVCKTTFDTDRPQFGSAINQCGFFNQLDVYPCPQNVPLSLRF